MELENVRKNIFHLKKLLLRERTLLDQEKQIANSMAVNIKQRGTYCCVNVCANWLNQDMTAFLYYQNVPIILI